MSFEVCYYCGAPIDEECLDLTTTPPVNCDENPPRCDECMETDDLLRASLENLKT